MSNSHARTGSTAAKAGASTGGKAAEVEATAAATATQTDENALQSDAKTPETEQNPVKATENDTPVLIPDSVDPAAQSTPAAIATQVVDAPAAPVIAPEVLDKAKELVGTALNVAAKPAATDDTPLVKVKFLRSHHAFGYFAGQEGEISQEDFDKYSQDGEFFQKL